MRKPAFSYKNGAFILKEYNWAAPFANQLHGMAGLYGIPLWVHYCNRGQAIASFGIESREKPILEFAGLPRALTAGSRNSFRTFLRIGGAVYEPFQPTDNKNIEQEMQILPESLSLKENNAELGLTLSVTYTPLTEAPAAGLLRRLTIQNAGKQEISLEIADGLPRIVPCDPDRDPHWPAESLHEGRLVTELVEGFPLFRAVPEKKSAHYYLSFLRGTAAPLSILVDPEQVFGAARDGSYPFGLVARTRTAPRFHGRTPCAFSNWQVKLPAGGQTTLESAIGFVPGPAEFARLRELLGPETAFEAALARSEQLAQEIQNHALTVSADPQLDQFFQHSFFLSVLQSGIPRPVTLSSGPSAFYVFGREPGSMQADNQDFRQEAAYFSQGPGDVHDLIQLRRQDSWFFPEIFDAHVRLFGSLIQLDGYSPGNLPVITYSIPERKGIRALEKGLKDLLADKNKRKEIEELCDRGFSPGQLQQLLDTDGITDDQAESIFELVMSLCLENDPVPDGSGFYMDHFHYLVDMIEGVLAIFPDRMGELLTRKNNYYFYENPYSLMPRREKYVLAAHRTVRQQGAVQLDPQKLSLLRQRESQPYRIRTNNGNGPLLQTTLFVKLLCVLANRICALDPEQIGVEMESGRTGWNRGMDGLPALLGSSLVETIELERLVSFLVRVAAELDIKEIKIFSDLYAFIKGLMPILRKRIKSGSAGSAQIFWEESHALREKFLQQTAGGVAAGEKKLTDKEFEEFFKLCQDLLSGIYSKKYRNKVFDRNGLPYTYFENRVAKWAPVKEKNKPRLSAEGLPLVQARKFIRRQLVRFLEAPVHLLRMHPEMRDQIFPALKESELYDSTLKMYRLSESLQSEPREIGRAREWPQGWYENEAISTQMAYRYLIGLLHCGLYREFYSELKDHFTCYHDVERLGRSNLDPVSYLVSSASGADQGQGCLPQLHCTNAEIRQIWTLMTAGEDPFYLSSRKKLQFQLRPALAEELFTRKNSVASFFNGTEWQTVEIQANSFAFKFLNRVLVIYRNKTRKNTWDEGVQIRSYKLYYKDGKTRDFPFLFLEETEAAQVRGGDVWRMDVTLW
ncbi:MAG: hypothetical protein HS115_01315 [Spirochaetales bacterium]|nr:hypothetical protein [Spirochaetales bacterium]